MRRLLFLVAFLMLGRHVMAATYYVSPAGSDATNCNAAQSANNPRKTIAGGLACAQPGDVVSPRAGTYVESFQNSIPSGTDGAYVTVRAYGAPTDTLICSPSAQLNCFGPSASAEPVIIQPPTGTSRVFWFMSNHHIEIAHVVIDAVNVSEDAVKVTNGSAGVAHHIRLRNNEIRNARNGPGLQQCVEDIGNNDPGAGFNEYLNNHVHHCGKDPNRDQGFYIGETKQTEVCGNWIHDIAADGVQLQYQGTADILVSNNLIEKTTGGGIVGVCEGCTGIKIANNIVRNTSGTPGINLAIGSLTAPALIDNNQVTGNAAGGIYVYPNFNPAGNQIKMTISNNYTWSNTQFDLKDDSNGQRATFTNNSFQAPGTTPPPTTNTISVSVTVNIDKTAPVVTVTSPTPGSTVTTPNVTLQGTISAGGSPVSVQCPGGLATLSGLNWTCPQTLSLGANQLDIAATDLAGNVGHSVITLTYATSGPATIKAVVTPAPNANGWNNTDVLVTFVCTNTTTCPAPVTVTTEGAGQVITGTATY